MLAWPAYKYVSIIILFLIIMLAWPAYKYVIIIILRIDFMLAWTAHLHAVMRTIKNSNISHRLRAYKVIIFHAV